MGRRSVTGAVASGLAAAARDMEREQLRKGGFIPAGKSRADGAFASGCLFAIALMAALCVLIGPVGLIAAFIVIPIINVAKKKDEADECQASQIIVAIVKLKRRELLVARRQYLSADRYGYVDGSRWEKELRQFAINIIQPKISHLKFYKPVTPERIEAIILDGVAQHELAASFPDNGNPLDYEIYCSELLRSIGWDARVTQASGDQGADVIATKADVKLVLQCKLYSRPVGNGAIQEAAGARAHEAADYAAVVTNSSFTKAARVLAATNDVELLHHDLLQDFADKIAGPD